MPAVAGRLPSWAHNLKDGQGNPPCRTLWICDMPDDVRDFEIRNVFSGFGKVETVIRKTTAIRRSDTFITFREIESAMRAIHHCQDRPFTRFGQPVTIRFSRFREHVETHIPAREDTDGVNTRSEGFQPPVAPKAMLAEQQNVRTASDYLLSGDLDISPPPLRRTQASKSDFRRVYDSYRPEEPCRPKESERRPRGDRYIPGRDSRDKDEPDGYFTRRRSSSSRIPARDESNGPLDYGNSPYDIKAAPSRSPLPRQETVSKQATNTGDSKRKDAIPAIAVVAPSSFRCDGPSENQEETNLNPLIRHTNGFRSSNMPLSPFPDAQSTTSSSSKSSQRKRLCAHCKEAESSLSGPFILCSTCNRRYHTRCGDPSPSSIAQGETFLCGPCRRKPKVASENAESTRAVSPELGPLLSNNDKPQEASDVSIASNDGVSEIEMPTDLSLSNSDQPHSKDATPTETQENQHRSIPRFQDEAFRKTTFASSPSLKQTDLPVYETKDSRSHTPATSPTDVQQRAIQMSRLYKEVTCPSLRKKGESCFHHGHCMFAHHDTGVYAPRLGYPNRHFTCYFWYHRRPCEYSSPCPYAHEDTGLYVGRDQKASVKHITCSYWFANGVCKYRDDECLFAHEDTGIYPGENTKRSAHTETTGNRLHQNSSTSHSSNSSMSASKAYKAATTSEEEQKNMRDSTSRRDVIAPDPWSVFSPLEPVMTQDATVRDKLVNSSTLLESVATSTGSTHDPARRASTLNQPESGSNGLAHGPRTDVSPASSKSLVNERQLQGGGPVLAPSSTQRDNTTLAHAVNPRSSPAIGIHRKEAFTPKDGPSMVNNAGNEKLTPVIEEKASRNSGNITPSSKSPSEQISREAATHGPTSIGPENVITPRKHYAKRTGFDPRLLRIAQINKRAQVSADSDDNKKSKFMKTLKKCQKCEKPIISSSLLCSACTKTAECEIIDAITGKIPQKGGSAAIEDSEMGNQVIEAASNDAVVAQSIDSDVVEDGTAKSVDVSKSTEPAAGSIGSLKRPSDASPFIQRKRPRIEISLKSTRPSFALHEGSNRLNLQSESNQARIQSAQPLEELTRLEREAKGLSSRSPQQNSESGLSNQNRLKGNGPERTSMSMTPPADLASEDSFKSRVIQSMAGEVNGLQRQNKSQTPSHSENGVVDQQINLVAPFEVQQGLHQVETPEVASDSIGQRVMLTTKKDQLTRCGPCRRAHKKCDHMGTLSNNQPISCDDCRRAHKKCTHKMKPQDQVQDEEQSRSQSQPEHMPEQSPEPLLGKTGEQPEALLEQIPEQEPSVPILENDQQSRSCDDCRRAHRRCDHKTKTPPPPQTQSQPRIQPEPERTILIPENDTRIEAPDQPEPQAAPTTPKKDQKYTRCDACRRNHKKCKHQNESQIQTPRKSQDQIRPKPQIQPQSEPDPQPPIQTPENYQQYRRCDPCRRAHKKCDHYPQPQIQSEQQSTVLTPEKDRQYTRCDACRRAHKKCKHQTQTQNQSQTQPKPLAPVVITENMQHNTICDSCRRAHKKCDHAVLPEVEPEEPWVGRCDTCVRQHNTCLHNLVGELDPTRCYEYLKEFDSGKRGISTLNRKHLPIIRDAAARNADADAEPEVFDALSDEDYIREDDDQGSQAPTAPSRSITPAEAKIQSHATHLGSRGQLLDNPTVSKTDGTADLPSSFGSGSILTPAHTPSPLATSASATIPNELNFADGKKSEVVQKLLARGVQFESDDSDLDEEMEDVNAPVPFCSDSGLWPKQSSLDLFEVAPLLRPPIRPSPASRAKNSVKSRLRAGLPKKQVWKNLLEIQTAESKGRFGNAHQHVRRDLPSQMVTTTVAQDNPITEEERLKFVIPDVEDKKVRMPFQKFLKMPEEPVVVRVGEGKDKNGNWDVDLAWREGKNENMVTLGGRRVRGEGVRWPFARG